MLAALDRYFLSKTGGFSAPFCCAAAGIALRLQKATARIVYFLSISAVAPCIYCAGTIR
jgi:biotin transporter BioY